MHAEARAFASEVLLQHKPELVLEFGSLDINGSVSDILPGAGYEVDWFGIDLQEGPGVDLVADAATYTHDFRVSMVVCCEVLEHAANWRHIVRNAEANLHADGHLLVTCATHPRVAHSAVDGGPLRSGEHYGNVGAAELIVECEANNLAVLDVRVSEVRGDLYLLAYKRAS